MIVVCCFGGPERSEEVKSKSSSCSCSPLFEVNKNTGIANILLSHILRYLQLGAYISVISLPAY